MLNFGTLIFTTSHQLASSYLLAESAGATGQFEGTYRDFLATVRQLPVLMNEYLTFQNLQRQGLARELVLEYVQTNLGQFQGVSSAELHAAHRLVEQFVSPVAAESTTPLDAAIQTLITETVAAPGRRRVNAYHAALALVCESLQQPVTAPEPAAEGDGFTAAQLLRGAEKPLCESLERLSEADRALVFVLAGRDEQAKQTLFESYHRQASALLADYPDSDAAQCLREMAYSPATVDDDLVDLHGLVQPDESEA